MWSLVLILMGGAQLCVGLPRQQQQDIDVLDSTRVNCKVSATITYPEITSEDAMPTVDCTHSCGFKTKDKTQTYFIGYVYRHFERLEQDYGLMLEIRYSQGGVRSCVLVPAAGDEAVLSTHSENNSPCVQASIPSTTVPTTLPSTTVPMTTVPITHDPISTTLPTTLPPSTQPPTTLPPTTLPPTTLPPTTLPPTTLPPTTLPPTTLPPTTLPPTTLPPTTTTTLPTTTTTTTEPTTTTTTTTTTTPTTTTTIPPTTTSWVCGGSDWVLIGTACFHVSSTEGGWHEGQDYCTGLGAQLASVNSQEEQDGLAVLAGSNAWIGLHDMQSEGDHLWEDQNTLAYSNWGPGQPDDSGSWLWWGGEDCVEMSKGISFQWNDQDCSNENIYICRKDAVLQG